MKLRIGELIFDAEARELQYGGQVARLEPKAAAILSWLAARPSETVRRSELLDAGWAEGGGSDEALTQAMAQVRRAFAISPASANYVQTVARTGYRLVAKVEEASAVDVVALAPQGSSVASARFLSGQAPLWLALAAAVSLVAFTMAPHGLRHWVMHHLHDATH